VRVDVGHRIRDLEVFSDGSLIMSTDSGKLITATYANK
jgi:glucose/arabinose dehydrogenase